MVATMESAKDSKNFGQGDHPALITLDLTGLKCPLPVLKARRQIGQMAAGAVQRLWRMIQRLRLILTIFVILGAINYLKARKIAVFYLWIAKFKNS